MQKWFTLEKRVTIGKRHITLKMVHTRKKSAALGKMGHTQKLGHTWKNGAYLGKRVTLEIKGSHLEKWGWSGAQS